MNIVLIVTEGIDIQGHLCSTQKMIGQEHLIDRGQERGEDDLDLEKLTEEGAQNQDLCPETEIKGLVLEIDIEEDQGQILETDIEDQENGQGQMIEIG